VSKSLVRWLPLVFLPFLLTGCWDRVEIEDRGFTIGAAIDLEENLGNEEDKNEQHVYQGTYQLVVPGGLGQGTGQGGGQETAYQNLSTVSDSLFEQIRDLAKETSRTPFFAHLEMIIVSDDVAKVPGAFSNIMDLFLRDHEMRRGVKVLISKGNAGDVLKVEPKPENLPVMFLDSIIENAVKNPQMLQEVRIGTVHEYLASNNSFVIPKIEMNGERVDSEGAAVIHGHNDTMVDFISGKTTEGLNFIKGDYKGGLVKAKIDENLVVYEIKNAKSTVEVNTDDKNKIKFHIIIQTEGTIGESFKRFDYTKPKNIEKVQNAMEDEIKKTAETTVEKLRDDLKVDALGLGGYVQRKNYALWKMICDDWDHGDNYFSKSEIAIEVNAIIRAPGSIIQIEK